MIDVLLALLQTAAATVSAIDTAPPAERERPAAIAPLPAQSALVVSFVGGTVALDVAAVLDKLNSSNLLPVQEVQLKKGQGPCDALRSLNVPIACARLLSTLAPLNPSLNMQSSSLAEGATIRLPKVSVTVQRSARTYDETDTMQRLKERQIRSQWTTKNVVPSKVGGLTRVEFDSYVMTIDYPDDHDVEAAEAVLSPLRSRNVLVAAELARPAVAKVFSLFPDHFQDDCKPDRHDLPIHAYGELLESDPELAAILAHASQPSVQPTVYVIDTGVVPNPALAGALVGDATPSPTDAAWTCHWTSFARAEHATHMAGIVAARNGQGFIGLAPTSQLVSIVWLRPESAGSETLVHNLSPHDLARKIAAIDGTPQAQRHVLLLASELGDYSAADINPATELNSQDVRLHYEANLTIHDEKPLLIAAAGEPSDGDPSKAIRLNEYSPHSPQNLGDWENAVIVTACATCGHANWSLLSSAYYGFGDHPVVHLAAPGGVAIPGWVNAQGIGAAAGTSQAAAFVAGVAAAMIARYPDAFDTAVAVKTRLQITSWPMDGDRRVATGIVDLQRALLDPSEDWINGSSGWMHGRIKAWPLKTLTLNYSDGGNIDVATARLLRLVRVPPDGSAFAAYTDALPSYKAPYRGVVNKFDAGSLADASGAIQLCDGRSVRLVDVSDVIVRTARARPMHPVTRAAAVSLTLLAGMISNCVAAAAEAACLPKELTTRYGDWTAEGIVISDLARVQSVQPATADGRAAVAMRMLIAAPHPGAAPWKLAIRNGDGHLLALLDKTDFVDAVTSVWTARLDGPAVTIALRGGDPQTEVEVRGVMAIGPAGDGAQTFSIKGSHPDWHPLYPTTTPMLRDAGEAVGILVAGHLVGTPPVRQTWSCSGVMIAPALFLTNWHCGGGAPGEAGFDGEVRSSAIVDLEWESGAPARRQFSVEKVELTDEPLDFAILRLKPTAGNSAGSAVPVAVATAAPSATDTVFMIHHAGGETKLISGSCRIRNPDWPSWTGRAVGNSKPELTHDCDTSPGASGAPVFNIDGVLIALHHLGFVDDAGCSPDRLNKAVKMSAIVAAVGKARPDLAKELKW